MKRKHIAVLLSFCITILLAGCGQAAMESNADEKIKVGIMLSDVGLGDQSFSDSAFGGLIKSRDELGILFDYREIKDTGTYEKGLTELVEEGNDLVIGLGFMVQEDLEKTAKKYPKQKFILIDAISELDNITSITFKEDEGSFLAGVVAAMTSKSNTVGFIGGADVPLINKFADGFSEGAKAVKPDIAIITEYANDFGNDKLGSEIAKKMIGNKADVLYAAAGFTGVGALKAAQESRIYAIGVDSDQYFYAEKSVITSMLKNVDVGIYQLLKEYARENKVPEGHIELGLKDNGVQLAPIRVISLTDEQRKTLDEWQKKLAEGN
ncbi:BMP family lipoprotein [Metabacillus dongyingensis]|uniref:BMP family lipoprotein n=1 Tax=Metabacillus dongyingensis TaxID=2874282 RepID=UPI001CC169CA|nr:BMP family ABC transporter substrate-binding protein [Metabacillus dongyingensis]UAL53282.1 BMP family ABC transporter substrate-binding protein [Metabacillus dongyingensis]